MKTSTFSLLLAVFCLQACGKQVHAEPASGLAGTVADDDRVTSLPPLANYQLEYDMLLSTVYSPGVRTVNILGLRDGNATLFLDPNECTLNAYGETAGCNEAAARATMGSIGLISSEAATIDGVEGSKELLVMPAAPTYRIVVYRNADGRAVRGTLVTLDEHARIAAVAALVVQHR